MTDERTGISWLSAESRLGFILHGRMTRSLYHEVPGRTEMPLLTISEDTARIGSVSFPVLDAPDRQVQTVIRNILECEDGASIFLASHFMYGTATRIIALSVVRPLLIIYREIDAMRVRLTTAARPVEQPS